ncbi:MAG: flavin reductase [Sphaerochaetaceae bacterium]|nr:flavin reductase [Sphaerochaetaceae bacterium]
MRKDLGAKAYLYPQPVLIISTYDEDGNIDVMNAAWGGMSDYKKISMCIDRGHRTTANVLKSGALTIAMADSEHVIPCDYVGIVSYNKDPEKAKKSGFTFTKSGKVNAPLINELPFAFECNLISYDEKTEIMVCEIVNISADERILDENGKIDLSVFHPITYDAANSAYVELGRKVGIAFKDGKALM